MKKLIYILLAGVSVVCATSCKDTESYADLLRDENHAVNAFLANYPLITSIPADHDFVSAQSIKQTAEFQAEYGNLDDSEQTAQALKLTPFYRMDEDGYVYMQVVNPGSGAMAEEDQQIYFRFTRINLAFLYKYGTAEQSGNESDLASTPTSFKFQNTSLTSTTQWGTGIQVPLEYLPLNCQVNIVIKSYLGPTEEVTSVYPYLYSIRYYPSRI
ncbi:MAG: DUF4827 domain-containing protein [Bacteroides sp.]|nr:DUF4827 domain-containing protein [Bacteroides sp.]MCM1379769.1 DUF4827 domain-containing protein [Bacteroides sp.]MCM1445690.1 DUF4827 domain-containing protein [Prevotella sp.]